MSVVTKSNFTGRYRGEIQLDGTLHATKKFSCQYGGNDSHCRGDVQQPTRRISPRWKRWPIFNPVHLMSIIFEIHWLKWNKEKLLVFSVTLESSAVDSRHTRNPTGISMQRCHLLYCQFEILSIEIILPPFMFYYFSLRKLDYFW